MVRSERGPEEPGLPAPEDTHAAAAEPPQATLPPAELVAEDDATEPVEPTPQTTEFALAMPDAPQHGSTGLGASDSLAAAPSCSHQCITTGVAYVHGSGVEIVVETSVPAQLYLSVVADLDHDGNYDDYWVETTSFGYTSYSWVIDSLVAGETYHVMAAATDGDLHTSYAWGQFTLP